MAVKSKGTQTGAKLAFDHLHRHTCLMPHDDEFSLRMPKEGTLSSALSQILPLFAGFTSDQAKAAADSASD